MTRAVGLSSTAEIEEERRAAAGSATKTPTNALGRWVELLMSPGQILQHNPLPRLRREKQDFARGGKTSGARQRLQKKVAAARRGG